MAEEVREQYYYIELPDLKVKVNTYIPLLAKAEWIAETAPKCLDAMELSYRDNALPTMYKENSDRKSRYLLGFFLRMYMNWKWEVAEDEDEWLLPYDEYDKWMRGHIFAQIEKFKSDKEAKDICFNLLAEYKDLERRLNNEIYGTLQVKNDPMNRQTMYQSDSMTPEALEEMLNGLNEAKETLDRYEALKDGKGEAVDNG